MTTLPETDSGATIAGDVARLSNDLWLGRDRGVAGGRFDEAAAGGGESGIFTTIGVDVACPIPSSSPSG